MAEGLRFTCIVIADDGSEEGEQAATTGIGIAASFGSQVILLGIIEPPNIGAEGEGLPIDDPSITRRTLEERFERFMRLGRNMEIKMSLQIGEGEPSAEINRVARRENADLIVVGRRNLSKFKRWFEGSTSEDILREAPCSLLIVQ